MTKHILLLLGCSATFASQVIAQGVGVVKGTVMLVAPSLDLKPVPKQKFIVRSEGGQSYEVTTSFKGEFELELPSGTYSIENEVPVVLGDTQFGWALKFEVGRSAVVRMELSNDNARTSAGTSSSISEGDLFKRFGGSVFKVINDSGHGSGFLVDRGGLIVTNYHVARNSDYLAVKVNEADKYPAELVAADAVNDVAVIRVNPQAVAGLAVLKLAEELSPPNVGDHVVAIGSPLSTENILTSGIVSKVESGAIFSDVRINPGNSGGPLLDSRGGVLGINTFIESRPGSPGVSGIVRSHLAKPVVEKALALLAGVDPPAAVRLPERSGKTIPADTLRQQALATTVKPSQYHVEAGKFDVNLVTPVVIASLSLESEKQAAQVGRRRNRGSQNEQIGSDFYEWRRYVGDFRPVVTIQATPELGLPPGSWAAAVLGGIGGVAPTGLRYWFKADFGRMELRRDGIVVPPYHPGRLRQVVDESLAGNRLTDIAYFGAYEYSPEAFMPGGQIELRIWEKGKDTPTVRKVPEEIANRVWSHFESYPPDLVQ